MKIGDCLRLVPSAYIGGREEQLKALPCRVVYIHPRRRYFTVEFLSVLTGETFRESFDCPDRPEIIQENPKPQGFHLRWD